MRLILSSLVLMLITATSFASASQLECGNIEIKKIINKKAHITRSRACTNKQRNVLISENCKDQRCKVLNFDPLQVSNKELSGQRGKPGFKLCREISGSPSLIEFKFKNQWYKLDECRVKADGSFVNTSELLEKLYKSRRK